MIGAILLVLSGRPGTGKTAVAREVARSLRACYLRVDAAETVLHDVAEHRRRVEASTPDIPGHAAPTWADVESGTWLAWDETRDGDRLRVDTTDTAAAVGQVLAHLDG